MGKMYAQLSLPLTHRPGSLRRQMHDMLEILRFVGFGWSQAWRWKKGVDSSDSILKIYLPLTPSQPETLQQE